MKKLSVLSHACLVSFLAVSCSTIPQIKFESDTNNDSTEGPIEMVEASKSPASQTPSTQSEKSGQSNPEKHRDNSGSPTPYPTWVPGTPEKTSKPSPTPTAKPTTAVSSTPVPTETTSSTPVPTATPSTITNPVPTPTAVVTTEPVSEGTPSLGINASLNGKRPFPTDNPWNQKVDGAEVDPNSDTLINSIGKGTGLHPDFGADWDGGPFGIPYIVVAGNTPKVPMQFDYADESDPGPYPIPANAPVEGGVNSDGDRHILVIDRDNWKLYETYYTFPSGNGYTAGSGAIFDLNSNAQRPAGWTSADAAGLPIFPGLVRYDEVVEQKAINHAIRFTVSKTRKGYVYPATHYASSNTSSSLPPMGMRVRLKSTFDISTYPANVQVILKAMKTYGMILADNGSNWYFSGAPDARWNDEELNSLKRITGGNFEVVKMGTIVTN